MRNLAWFVFIVIIVGLAAAWSRPRYEGPLLGTWSCVVCFSRFDTTYRADGVVEFSPRVFGGSPAYGTYEVDETHSVPVLITTERVGNRVSKSYCIWKITREGKLRTESFEPGKPIPTKFSQDPNPLLYTRVP